MLIHLVEQFAEIKINLTNPSPINTFCMPTCSGHSWNTSQVLCEPQRSASEAMQASHANRDWRTRLNDNYFLTRPKVSCSLALIDVALSCTLGQTTTVIEASMSINIGCISPGYSPPVMSPIQHQATFPPVATFPPPIAQSSGGVFNLMRQMPSVETQPDVGWET